MKKILLSGIVGLSFFAGYALATPVKDWVDLYKVHEHILQSIKDMEKARAANHYDMDGHGAKAEELLNQASEELHLAVDSIMKVKGAN